MFSSLKLYKGVAKQLLVFKNIVAYKYLNSKLVMCFKLHTSPQYKSNKLAVTGSRGLV
jgi:hypothetical protein